MDNKLRKITLIIIALLAIVASMLSIVSMGLTILEFVKNFGFDSLTSSIDSLLTYGIDLLFAFFEISFGFKLIKVVREDDHFETYKMTSGIITATVLPLFAILIVDAIFAFVFQNPIGNVNILFLVLFFLVMIISSFIRPVVLRRKLLALDLIILSSSLLSLIMVIMSFNMDSIVSEVSTIDSISNVINCVMLSVLVLFSLSSFIYFMRNPDACLDEERENEDVDIIETHDTYEKVKLYSYRGVDNVKTKIAFVISILISFLGVLFSILFFVENGYHLQFTDKINSLVQLFKGNIVGGLSDTFYFLIEITIPLLAFLYSTNYLFGVIAKNAQYKIMVIYMMQLGSLFLTVVFFVRLIEIVTSFTNYSFSFEKLSIADIGLLAVFLINSFISKIFKHTVSDVYNGIKNGDSFHEHAGKITKMNIIYGLISTVATALCIYEMYLNNGNISYSYFILISMFLLGIIGSSLENKNPPSEYLIVKRKRKV